MTQITRRDFLKLTSVATGGLLLPAGAAVAAGEIQSGGPGPQIYLCTRTFH